MQVQGALTVWLTSPSPCWWIPHHVQRLRGLNACSLMMSSMIAVLFFLLQPWSQLLIAFTSVQPSDHCFSTWWWHWHWLMMRKSAKGWNHRGDDLITLSLSVNHPQIYACTPAHTLNTYINPPPQHTHTQTTSVTALNIITVCQFSLSPWLLDS